MKADLYDATGARKGSVDLNEKIFGAKINQDLMHRFVVMQLSNARTPVAHTLTRAEVSKTTKKAFKQKGTGNARRGSLSTSLLRGGGVTHGPRNTVNFTKEMPKRERRAALFSSLSAKAEANEIFALEKFSETKPSTKKFAELLAKLPVAKKYLLVIPAKNMALEKSVANLPQVQTVLASYLNPYDVINSDKVCFLEASLPLMEKTFLTPSAK